MTKVSDNPYPIYGQTLKQTSQPQNTENLETDAKKSEDFSKSLEIDRPADKTK